MASERFLNALNGVAQNTPPVWLMRQAGRYHSHYQGIRKQHSFVEMCRQPDLAAEVARGPVADFDFDLAILFSDLLFPLEALGLSLRYEDSGPKLEPRLDASQLGSFRSVEQALPYLEFQREAVRRTRAVLPESKSLIGFVGGPWTLFVYAVEGSHQGALRVSKSDPSLYHRFVDRIVPLLLENIRLQLDGGAEIVVVMDTAAGELPPDWFIREVLPHVETLVSAFPRRIGYYTRGTQPAHLRTAATSAAPYAGFGVDWRWDMTEALQMFGGRGFVQGNYDPGMMFLPADQFDAELRSYFAPLARLTPEQRRGWVCGLGHGVLPATPEENVRNFVRIARETFA